MGYHLLPQGKLIINQIKSSWNNKRLTTYIKSSNAIPSENLNVKLNNNKPDNLDGQINKALQALYLVPSPYEIRNGVRFIRGTDNLARYATQKLKIKVINGFLNKEYFFSSISECGKILELDRTKIKKSILTGEPYKNYKRGVAVRPEWNI